MWPAEQTTPSPELSFLLPTCSCTTFSQHCVIFLRLLLGRTGEGPGLRSRPLLFLLTVETEGKAGFHLSPWVSPGALGIDPWKCP